MALYFFDVVDGGTQFQDPEGTECVSVEDARLEAMRALYELTRDNLGSEAVRHFTMFIRDGNGTRLWTVELSFQASRH